MSIGEPNTNFIVILMSITPGTFNFYQILFSFNSQKKIDSELQFLIEFNVEKLRTV